MAENALTAVPFDKDPIDIVVAGDIIFDEILTENLCHVMTLLIYEVVSALRVTKE